MVPCWPLCWASLAPAAQHESDNQGIVHLTPSSSTFSHHGCILYSVLLYSVLYTPHPQLFLLLTSRRVEPKNLRIIRNLSSQPQVGSGSPFSHFTPFGIFTTKRQENNFETFSILNVSQSNPHELLESQTTSSPPPA